jgi:hypothetical protein
MVDEWIGPAIIAAIVSGLVSAVGWFVNSWQARALEKRRREEKVHDYQVALRAEIAGDLLNLRVADRQEFLAAVTADYKRDPDYAPFVPRLPSNVVFGAIVDEIHVLDGSVIAPIIHYAQLRQAVEQLIDDLRGSGFRRLSRERQLTMYGDYIATLDRLEVRAETAVAALNDALSSSDADPLNQALASAQGAGPAASDGEQVVP